MSYFFIFIAFIAYFIEGKDLFRKGMKKELATGGVILLLALILLITKSFGIVTPINFLKNLFEPIGRMYLNPL